MLVYREKDNLIYKLHPVTVMSYIAVVLLLSLIFSHPVYLLVLFFAVGAVIIASGNADKWKYYLLMASGIVVMIILVNSVFVQNGSTVLFYGPAIPVMGKIKVTLEAVCFSAAMGIRLVVIISVFCLYTYAVHPDKVLKLFSRFGKKAVLVVTLATRLFPLMVQDVRRVTEVQRCRGVKLDTGSLRQRLKNRLPVVKVVLLSSLERSMQIAESMHARGYGSGPRSFYSRDLWRPRDFFVLGALVVSVMTGLAAVFHDWAVFTYYPRLENMNFKELNAALIEMLALSLPAFLNWGWKRWQLLKLKI
ncbi:MAG: energy-coupling factor transporter transmembrane protein EcfT [Clostridiales bacterium]|nr:energy-coupling factor transporter transmembrane protein EcfT [Clostridiales bacterium]MCF8022926.1 energy-coupling factor transporter transmembrane protein EcfT [Clostridiales bacterium]